jgi:alpha-L-fucosidase
MRPSRRGLLGATTALGVGLTTQTDAHAKRTANFAPSWESLADGYQTPEWFRDAKLGLWAHWGPQCVPEYGDWYGRQMYIQGNRFYEHHVKTYGHPAQFGFMEFLKNWKADAWQPERLMGLYKAAGAKYFVAMANHHDNFDMYDSTYHEWNSVKVGPKRDVCGEWEKAARKAGLKFGLSNHAAHAWHWWQTAYGYDAEGPARGLRYDAARLKKSDGKGKWWDGLDPQELYGGPQGDMVPPDGLTSIKDMNAYNDAHSGQWLETAPPKDPYFVRKWLMRQNEMVDKYRPDLVYFDNYGLPLEKAGLEATAHYYNQSLKANGSVQVVATGKKLSDLQRRAIVEDVERGFSDRLRAEPWQTCTCIGDWHYDRPLYERGGYKPALEVIQRLNDVVAKNGNMLLSIPVRGDGSIDEKEEKILADMAQWMAINGEAIFATRPWTIYGEGPFRVVEGMQNEGAARPFTHEDIRFTTKAGVLYALPQLWPDSGFVTLTSLREDGPYRSGTTVERVELLGHGEPLRFEMGIDGLTIKLPEVRPSFTPALKIMGKGLIRA